MYAVKVNSVVQDVLAEWPEKNRTWFMEFLDHMAEDPVARTYDGGGSNDPDVFYRITPYEFLYLVQLTVSDKDGEKTMTATGIGPRTQFSRFV